MKSNTHQNIIIKAFYILKNDKYDVWSFYNEFHAHIDSVSVIKQNTVLPDKDENPWWGITHCYNAETDSGGALFIPFIVKKNGTDNAKTRFINHYNNAVKEYKNQNFKKAFEFLGRALHYLTDAGNPHHSFNKLGGISGSIFGSQHEIFEKYVIENLDRYNALTSDFYSDILNFPLENAIKAVSKNGCIVYNEMNRKNDNTISKFEAAAQNTLPYIQQMTAAVLYRFYYDVTNR